jgi:glycosyltransferase involved in cell wall biosynthesis
VRVLVTNPGADVYGSDLQMLESVTALTGAGFDVLVVSPEAGPLHERLLDVGARTEVVRFPVIRRAYLSPTGLVRLGLEVLRAGPALRSTLRSARPDVVYVNTTTIPWWILAARAARVPVLCHVHEAEDADPGPVRRLMALPLAAADRVLFISRTAERAALEVLPRLRRRSVVILNGVPERPDPPVSPPAGRRPRLGFVSRLSERKAQHVAIAAVDILHRRGRTVELELAGTVYPGNEAYEERLHRQVREHGLEELVTFSGYVAPSAAVFDRSDVALSLSTRDALGNVVVEAQLAERPVVAAGVGGHLESIVDGETGVHVPPGDPHAVADAVESLLADPVWARQIAVAGRDSARELFGVRRYGDRVVALVRELAAAEQPRR